MQGRVTISVDLLFTLAINRASVLPDPCPDFPFSEKPVTMFS